MKTADAIWMCLPEGMGELFEIVRFEKTDQSYDIWLDEKKKLSDEDFRNPNIVARGYTDYVTVQDYPMRGRPVFLYIVFLFLDGLNHDTLQMDYKIKCEMAYFQQVTAL
ncbi:transposase family protein [Duncaniella freteri]|uniref:ISAon1 family transposase N-terminal region protein n=1 Tax=Duncaniella freteri TaxID=2530391 RepID=UPI0025774068|nr:transposase family protein [Duncaniella freteri]